MSFKGFHVLCGWICASYIPVEWSIAVSSQKLTILLEPNANKHKLAKTELT